MDWLSVLVPGLNYSIWANLKITVKEEITVRVTWQKCNCKEWAAVMGDPNLCTLCWVLCYIYETMQCEWHVGRQRVCALCLHACIHVYNNGDSCARLLVLDVDQQSGGSKQKCCPHSIFSMSAGVAEDLWNVKMTGASWARGYEVTSWCVCAWITLPHTPSQRLLTFPQTQRHFHSWRLVTIH